MENVFWKNLIKRLYFFLFVFGFEFGYIYISKEGKYVMFKLR